MNTATQEALAKAKQTPEFWLECLRKGVKFSNVEIQSKSRAHLLAMGWNDDRIDAALLAMEGGAK